MGAKLVEDAVYGVSQLDATLQPLDGGNTYKLSYNADGSVDIYLTNKRPANESYNWAPSPQGHFKVLLRIYWPKPEALDGSWKLPPLEKLD